MYINNFNNEEKKTINMLIKTKKLDMENLEDLLSAGKKTVATSDRTNSPIIKHLKDLFMMRGLTPPTLFTSLTKVFFKSFSLCFARHVAKVPQALLIF